MNTPFYTDESFTISSGENITSDEFILFDPLCLYDAIRGLCWPLSLFSYPFYPIPSKDGFGSSIGSPAPARSFLLSLVSSNIEGPYGNYLFSGLACSIEPLIRFSFVSALPRPSCGFTFGISVPRLYN